MFFLVSLVSVRFVSFFPHTLQEFYACLFLHSLSVLHARADRCVFSSIYAFLIGQSGRGCSGRWLISQNSSTGEVQSLGVTINLYPWPPPRPRCRHSVLVPQDRVTKWRCLMVASLNAINHTSQPANQPGFCGHIQTAGPPAGFIVPLFALDRIICDFPNTRVSHASKRCPFPNCAAVGLKFAARLRDRYQA